MAVRARRRIAAASAAGDRPQEMSGEPPGQVQEMEVLDLGRQAPDLGRERRQERVAQRGLLVDEPVERVAPQDLVSTASMATAVADRGAPSSRASSPKNPPGPDRREDRRLRAVVRRAA